ncbi:MAG TPA: hypothetical protein PLV21_07430 [Cyclobacteriaceae bacterium]|nr:hypothetical protein [Cyclobacteriaceae bacterium]HRJ81696.1 hypothetical protein [Cyclobacteriaceae bacterium]
MKAEEKQITPEPENRLSGHGYTAGQVHEIHELQKQSLKGEAEIPLIEPNNGKPENFKDSFFKNEFAGHKISKFDAVHYHVIQEQRFFDPNTGERKSTAFIQQYHKEAFDFMITNKGFGGMITHVLHDPTRKV